MKVQQLLDNLRGVEGSMKMTISPGPFTLMVDKQDAIASELIDWIKNKLGDDAKVSDVLHVLDAARWWVITLSTWYSADKHNEDSMTSNGKERP